MDAEYHSGVLASEHTGNVPERSDLKKWLVRRVECMRGHMVRVHDCGLHSIHALTLCFDARRTSTSKYFQHSVSAMYHFT
jgi:hypothetical protein